MLQEKKKGARETPGTLWVIGSLRMEVVIIKWVGKYEGLQKFESLNVCHIFAQSSAPFNIQGVPVLVCQTKLGDRDHRSKKILSKDPYPEMNRLASRRM